MRMSFALIAVALLVIFVLVLLLMPRKAAMFGREQTLRPTQYQTDFVQVDQPHLLLDVRTPEEFAGGHIRGAVNISLQALPQRLAEIPQDQPVVIYCRSGNRSRQALHLLAQAGYTRLYDLGGVIQWQAQGLPLQ
jgi:phage shock protein E